MNTGQNLGRSVIEADGPMLQHDPNDYCCPCERCDLERTQAALLARTRPPTNDDDYAGSLSSGVTRTERHYRR